MGGGFLRVKGQASGLEKFKPNAPDLIFGMVVSKRRQNQFLSVCSPSDAHPCKKTLVSHTDGPRARSPMIVPMPVLELGWPHLTTPRNLRKRTNTTFWDIPAAYPVNNSSWAVKSRVLSSALSLSPPRVPLVREDYQSALVARLRAEKEKKNSRK